MSGAHPEIADLIRQDLAETPEPAAIELAEAAAARIAGTRAVLLYGSCRRDGLSDDAIADLYALVDDYRTGQSLPAAWANWALPPNVIYLEAATSAGQLRAKVAIVRIDAFERRCGPAAFDSYFWARFCQPATLLWSRDRAAAAAVERALTKATLTFAGERIEPAIGPSFWADGLARTYAAELRAERGTRGRAIYLADQARYDAIAARLAADPPPARGSAGRWRRRRALGKARAALRLAKAAFTFTGGLDYLLWKIARHSGVELQARPWQRRWPLLAAPGLALRLWRRGAFR